MGVRPTIALGLIVLLACASAMSPTRANDELTRDQLIDAMVSLTHDGSWQCGGVGCDKLRGAFPRFFRRGNDLFVESLVRIDRNLPFHRAVVISRAQHADRSWEQSWELHFQIEHYSASVSGAFPMIMQCQPDSDKQFHCRVAEGRPFDDAGGGFQNYKLSWYR